MSRDLTPRRSHLTFLATIRALELDVARSYLPASVTTGIPCRLLEVGAGTGEQARQLSELGYAVSALDLRDSPYRNVRCFDILEYDGSKIPLPDRSQDVVFSSHVLEHVNDLDGVLREMHRVLADDGVCVHLIPTPSCRAWTLAAHYLWLARRVMQKLQAATHSPAGSENTPRVPRTVKAWFWTLFPARHGERGNTVTEIYFYSRHFWIKTFEKSDFQVIETDSNRLFYTMANAVGPGVSIENRRSLARILGSACHVYVVKKRLRLE